LALQRGQTRSLTANTHSNHSHTYDTEQASPRAGVAPPPQLLCLRLNFPANAGER